MKLIHLTDLPGHPPIPVEGAGTFPIERVMLSLLARGEGTCHVAAMRLEAGGLLGYHPATVAQLFVVIAGSGWVRAGDGMPVAIAAGTAAYWTQGEGHETGTDTGLVALVLEGDSLALTARAAGLQEEPG